MTYRKDLQSLRALAVAIVVLEHVGFSFFSGGFIGVDVFFVLSGYLITGILLREIKRTNQIKIGNFILHRLKRLFPALFVVVCTSTLLAFLLFSEHQFNEQTGSKIYTLIWLSNLYFSFSQIDYFSNLETKDIFLHTWSLGVEEQFYWMWPLFILLSYILSKRYLKGDSIKTNWLLVPLIIAFTTSFALSLFLTYKDPTLAYYLMPTRVWQFSLGAISFLILEQENKIKLLLNNQNSFLLGITVILFCSIFIDATKNYPGVWALLPSFGAALVILSNTENNQPRIISLIQTKPIIYLGNISYSLYLWHWPLLMILPFVAIQLGFQMNDWISIIIIILSILISLITYTFVELPFWKGSHSNTSNQATLSVFLLFLLIGLFGFIQLDKVTEKKIKQNQLDSITAARQDLPEIYQFGCDTWYHSSNLRPCLIGNENAPNTMVILGDSIALQWFSFWRNLFSHSDWKMIVLTKSACPIVDEPVFYARINRQYRVCEEWREKSIDLIKRIKPDYLVLGSSSGYKYNQLQWTQGTEKILEQLTSASEKILIISGTPELSMDALSCLAAQKKTTPSSKYSILEASKFCEKLITANLNENESVEHYLRKATLSFENAEVISFNDLICPNSQCKLVSDSDTIVFRDDKHLTNTFVISQTKILKERLKNIWPELFPINPRLY